MARTLVAEPEKEVSLNDLVKSYYENKLELDSYKKLCESENAQIKAKMGELKQNALEVDDLTAKIIVKHSESFNEERLLAVAKYFGLDVIRTKEYVDVDALESLLYAGEVPNDAKKKLNECKQVKETIELRVTRKKEAK